MTDAHSTNVDDGPSTMTPPSPLVAPGVIDLRDPTSSTTERAIRAYRDAHALSAGPFPQIQGLLADDVKAALADDRTITGAVQCPDASTVEVPVLTPIEFASWFSSEYRTARFGAEIDTGFTCWHLSTFPSLDDESYAELLREAMVRLRSVSPGGAILFADHAERSDDPSERRLGPLLQRISGGAMEASLGTDRGVREHYLAGIFEAADGDGPIQRASTIIHPGTTVYGAVTDEQFVDELWAIYERPFKRMAEATPLRTYFERQELRDVISKDGVVQVSHRAHGRLVSWLMMTTRFDSFPWMDPHAFYAVDSTVPPERVHVFPGLVTDEDFRGNHCAGRLFDAVALSFLEQGPRHMIVFETVDENVGFLPRLIEDAATVNGYGKLRFQPVGVQRLRAWTMS